jgi:UDP:flavonoid glycosyltransferase YjiC (YdhE family)
LEEKLNILICPLEWGLGHAARMIPISGKLKALGHNIIIGSGEKHSALFRSEIHGLTYVDFTGFKPGYSRYLPQYLSLLLKIPSLIFHIISEHKRLKRIVREHHVDIVISDNRFGLWNKDITSVYITHMPLIPFPKGFRFLEPVGITLHRMIIKKYSLCLIPDLPGAINFSGRLSHGVILPDNIRYIGILSRFTNAEPPEENSPFRFPHNTVILSGPEPQREIFRQKLIAVFRDIKPLTIMLEGKPGKSDQAEVTGNVICYSHLKGSQMKGVIETSENIVTRSGYTTIMELVSLNRHALIIPTPGQTEQEYLAEYLSQKGWFSTLQQHELNAGITPVLDKDKADWVVNEESSKLLEKALGEMLEMHHKKE